MIIKLLNELKELREKKDYKNYRTLADVLAENIYQNYFNYDRTLDIKNTEEFHETFKLIILELGRLHFIADNALQEKEYGVLKIVTQCHGILQRLNYKYQYILKELNSKW
jgi:DNA-binding ferritin-like protein (Dps family)